MRPTERFCQEILGPERNALSEALARVLGEACGVVRGRLSAGSWVSVKPFCDALRGYLKLRPTAPSEPWWVTAMRDTLALYDRTPKGPTP
jgi:hypothetical protein